MKLTQISLGSILLLMSVLAHFTEMSIFASGYTQIVLPFKSEKAFSYEWIRSENALLVRFPGTSPGELEAFNNYDERLVRRVVVKDLGPAGTEVRLILKNRDVRALVSSFKDPFRVIVDLFDKDFAPKKDPVSGLPLLESNSLNAGAQRPEIPAAILGGMEPGNSSPSAQTNQWSPSEDAGQKDSKTKRKLLQSLPEEISSPNQLKAAMAQIPPGLGKAWLDFPAYVYRAQLAPYEGREAPESDTSPFQAKAVKTTSGMADYASKLYDLGHEGRALIAYQQVLLKEPGVFERDPVHLWKFAECHLGQGNLQLANGYYSTLIDKNPTHPLAVFAHLRKLDLIAIKNVQSENVESNKTLVEKLASIESSGSPEQRAQALIRKTWWETSSPKGDSTLPVPSEDTHRKLTSYIPKVESQKTAFLASSLSAARVTQASTPWERTYGDSLNKYFTMYNGPAVEPIRSRLSDAAKTRIEQELKSRFAAKDYIGCVSVYESLPGPLKSIRKVPNVGWVVAESYREVGQLEKAIPLYQSAVNQPVGIDRFKAQFWLMNTAGSVAQDSKLRKSNQDKIRQLAAISSEADTGLATTWEKLNSDERAQIQSAMSVAIEENVASDLKMKTPAKILLDKFSSTLSANPPKISTTNGNNPTNQLGNSSPSSGTVHLLDDLGKKFASLGMNEERRRALQLMRFIQPASIQSDSSAQKVWSEQLKNLAEEHRRANEFLEAGELYKTLGESAGDNVNRAEANYKGGLLLYRAGKKQEAIKALEKAKADPNNLFYSKLASERLDQLNAH